MNPSSYVATEEDLNSLSYANFPDPVGKELGVTREEFLGGRRRREISKARSVFCCICSRRLGLTGSQLSEVLRVSPAFFFHLARLQRFSIQLSPAVLFPENHLLGRPGYAKNRGLTCPEW